MYTGLYMQLSQSVYFGPIKGCVTYPVDTQEGERMSACVHKELDDVVSVHNPSDMPLAVHTVAWEHVYICHLEMGSYTPFLTTHAQQQSHSRPC